MGDSGVPMHELPGLGAVLEDVDELPKVLILLQGSVLVCWCGSGNDADIVWAVVKVWDTASEIRA